MKVYMSRELTVTEERDRYKDALTKIAVIDRTQPGKFAHIIAITALGHDDNWAAIVETTFEQWRQDVLTRGRAVK